MKIAYFDCFSGISGDMILGGLIDLGLKPEELKRELRKLDIPDFKLKVERVKRKGIGGVGVEVVTKDTKSTKGAKGTHSRKASKPEDVINILKRSSIDEEIKKSAKKIFDRLAASEAKIHRKSKKDARFHELGEVDTIVDVVGVLAGIKKLGIERVYSSPLHVGSGFVRCAHGILPVPAPATLELVGGIPIYGKDIEAELVTPTGAALISFLAHDFGEMPLMKVERIAYGAGKKELAIPNLLRILLGTEDEHLEGDRVSVIQTNIDDMNPQLCGYLMDELLKRGALDVWFTPIQMKNNRPAITLSVLADMKDTDGMCELIFNESTTLGVRISPVKRKKLAREERVVKTKYGRIKVKLGRVDGVTKNIAPSYGDCQKLARKLGIPLKKIYEEAKKEALSLLG